MNALQQLQNFDLDTLDMYEKMMFNDHFRIMTKTEALQIIINDVDGDFTQLTYKLSEIAEQQEEEFANND